MFAKVMLIVKSKQSQKDKDLLHDEQVIGDEVPAPTKTETQVEKQDAFFTQEPVA